MAKRTQKLNKQKIVSLYTDYLLIKGTVPQSVYSFAKENNFEESEFYNFFGSFSAIDESIFGDLFDSSLTVINQSEDYPQFEAKDKLLAFYFTYFENLTANRSLIKHLLEKDKPSLQNLKVLKSLRQKFVEYVSNIGIETIDVKEERFQKAQLKGLQESAWIQFLLTIKFWLDDTSVEFEKTDIFIEKAVNASFELMNTKPLKSVLDFGKFVLQERTGFFK